MLILETNIEVIKSTKQMLSSNFDMKDLGIADVILGIKIIRTLDGISLSKSHYVDKMIERFKKHGIKENMNPFLSHNDFVRTQELQQNSWSILRLLEV